MELDLREINPSLHDKARRAILDDRDAIALVCLAGNANALQVVVNNQPTLVELGNGLYERCLLHALVAPRVNNHDWPLDYLVRLLSAADPLALWFAGDADDFPDEPYLTVYRGVAGEGPDRWERGIHWTLDRATAEFFAKRSKAFAGGEASILSMDIETGEALAYYNGREEQEVIMLPPESGRYSVEPISL
jgi:hypothetical protein